MIEHSIWSLMVATSVSATLGDIDGKAAMEPKHTDVYVSGTEGYHTFRIPSVVVTQKGTLLAFCEGRARRGDHSENDIVVKRSTDRGDTWGPLQVIAEDGKNALLNPCAVVVRETGRVLLMYQRYAEGFHTNKTVPGYDLNDKISRSFITHSDDDGQTWAEPREITRQVKPPTKVTATPVGPGVAIQLRRAPYAGRIVMPFVHQIWPLREVCVAYSDDRGDTWLRSEYAARGSDGTGAEVQVVELTNGDVMMNVRSMGGNKRRKIAISKDGGETWSGLLDDPTLIEPQCQGSILRYTDPLDGRKSRILFANPASTEGRENGTVRLSYDEGKTWPVSRVIYPGGYAYSCLTVLPDDTIGLLYERDGYAAITFARFTLEWLTDGEDET
ncbi:MAG: exo-alpha-sialidase [Armatimonadota bacterium]